MKKILSTALLLTLATAVFTAPVSANEIGPQVETTITVSANHEIGMDVLEGTIKEIGDFDLIVES